MMISLAENVCNLTSVMCSDNMQILHNTTLVCHELAPLSWKKIIFGMSEKEMIILGCQGDLKDSKDSEVFLRLPFIHLSLCVSVCVWNHCRTVCVWERVREQEFWFVRVSFFRVIERRWPQEVVFQSFSSGVCAQLRTVSPQELPLQVKHAHTDTKIPTCTHHLYTHSVSKELAILCVCAAAL